MSNNWSIRTGDGNVTLQLPRDFQANLELHTGDGHIDTDFPIVSSGKINRSNVHAKLNGGEHVSHTIAPDGGWHTWRTQWDEAGMRFWLDYVDGAQPYFDVPASSLPDWPFNTPGYTLFPILNLAVAGSGGGDPAGGTYPAEMLVDWVRVW